MIDTTASVRTIRDGDEGGFVPSLAVSFDQIRASASGNVAILLRILNALEAIASLTDSPGRQRALHEQLQWIAELADRTVHSPHDRTRCESRLARVRHALEAP